MHSLQEFLEAAQYGNKFKSMLLLADLSDTQLTEAFNMLDTDGNGELTWLEVQSSSDFSKESQLPPIVSMGIKIIAIVFACIVNVMGIDVIGNATLFFVLMVTAPFLFMIFLGLPR